MLSAATLRAADRIGPLNADGVSAELKAAVEDKGYRIDQEGLAADFWFARALALVHQDAPGALYPTVANGELVGVVTFPKGTSDFRGQAVPAGTVRPSPLEPTLSATSTFRKMPIIWVFLSTRTSC